MYTRKIRRKKTHNKEFVKKEEEKKKKSISVPRIHSSNHHAWPTPVLFLLSLNSLSFFGKFSRALIRRDTLIPSEAASRQCQRRNVATEKNVLRERPTHPTERPVCLKTQKQDVDWRRVGTTNERTDRHTQKHAHTRHMYTHEQTEEGKVTW